MRKVRVVWTDEEFNSTAKKYARLRLAGLGKTESLTLMQDELPTVRRRQLQSIQNLPESWHKAANRFKLNFLTDQASPKKVEVIVPEPSPSKEQALNTLRQQYDSAFMSLLADMVADRVLARIANHIPNTEVQPVDKAVPSTETICEKESKKKVVVAGMLTKQIQLVLHDFPSLSIRVVTKTTSARDIQNVVSNADAILGMTDHMSHQLEASIISSAKRGRYTRVTGGMTSFRKELSKIANILQGNLQ